MRLAILCVPMFPLAWSPARAAGVPERLIRDPGFEAVAVGRLSPTGRTEGWEVQIQGREAVRDRLRVECVTKSARTGSRCLALSIPAHTVGFEYVTIGQRVQMRAGTVYEASVWVRWPGGPERAPASAGAASGHPSAIVSFWVRHRDGTGHFAGRDVWLHDCRWRRLSFRFCATDPGRPALIYVSLLPHQLPADTTVLVDDFTLTGRPMRSANEPRSGSLLNDPGFDAQCVGGIREPWRFVGIGGSAVQAWVTGTDDGRLVTLTMPAGTSNLQSGRLMQCADLRAGVRYRVTCRLRWDSFAADGDQPIVNSGAYDAARTTWYGPVDLTLERTGEWVIYSFDHIPPASGMYELYVQLNGWGNFGRAVRISVDDFGCERAADTTMTEARPHDRT